MSLVPIVRVPATAPHLIAAVLDAGAMGVLVPTVESGEQAERFVAAAKYPPEGRRGFGPLYADEFDDFQFRLPKLAVARLEEADPLFETA